MKISANAYKVLWAAFMVTIFVPALYAASQTQGLGFSTEGLLMTKIFLAHAFPSFVGSEIPKAISLIWSYPVFALASILPEAAIFLVKIFRFIQDDVGPLIAVCIALCVKPPFMSRFE